MLFHTPTDFLVALFIAFGWFFLLPVMNNSPAVRGMHGWNRMFNMTMLAIALMFALALFGKSIELFILALTAATAFGCGTGFSKWKRKSTHWE